MKLRSLNLAPILAYSFFCYGGLGGGFLLTEKVKELGCQLRSKEGEKIGILTT